MQRPSYQELFKFNLSLAGPGATFFAQYQSDTIARLNPNLLLGNITVVDIGCGDGLLTSFIAAHFYNATIHGVDISTEHIDVARMAYPHIRFHTYTNTLPFADACVDFIIMADTLHHIPPHTHAQMIAEIMRILKPGGTCCILEPNPYNPFSFYRFMRDPEEQDARMLSARKLKKLLYPYGTTRTLFYHFFPESLQKLRIHEPYLSWLLLGKLYACITIKK